MFCSHSIAESVIERVQDDLSKGKDVIITSYVGLWYEHQNDPEKNLYWGALYGHGSLFDRSQEIKKKLPFVKTGEYDTIHDAISQRDPIRIKVIKSPDKECKSGECGGLIVVYLAYKDMQKAVFDMGMHLKTGKIPSAVDDAELIRLLKLSYIMGYWGHNVYYGGAATDNLEDIKKSMEDSPRGVFILGCQTAVWFPQKFMEDGIEPITFTTTNMAPEAYIAVAMYDGILRGLSIDSININIATAYKVYQRLGKPPYSLFTGNPEQINGLADSIK